MKREWEYVPPLGKAHSLRAGSYATGKGINIPFKKSLFYIKKICFTSKSPVPTHDWISYPFFSHYCSLSSGLGVCVAGARRLLTPPIWSWKVYLITSLHSWTFRFDILVSDKWHSWSSTASKTFFVSAAGGISMHQIFFKILTTI